MVIACASLPSFRRINSVPPSILLHWSSPPNCPQHIVDGEAGANLTEHLYIVQIQQPVGVVYHQCLALGKVNKSGHLLLKALAVVGNGFGGHHLAHIGTAGWVANHCGTAADEGNWLVACHLQTLHQAQRHEVTYMEAIGSGVKANVKGCLAVIYHLSNFFFIGYLCQQATGFQFFVYLHRHSSDCSIRFLFF